MKTSRSHRTPESVTKTCISHSTAVSVSSHLHLFLLSPSPVAVMQGFTQVDVAYTVGLPHSWGTLSWEIPAFIRGFQENLLKLYPGGRHYFYCTGWQIILAFAPEGYTVSIFPSCLLYKYPKQDYLDPKQSVSLLTRNTKGPMETCLQ